MTERRKNKLIDQQRDVWIKLQRGYLNAASLPSMEGGLSLHRKIHWLYKRLRPDILLASVNHRGTPVKVIN